MSFLLDTNICSAHLKRPGGLGHRIFQHSGRLYVSTVIVGELFTWAYGVNGSRKLIEAVHNFLRDAQVIPLDLITAENFGEVRALLLSSGITVPPMDLLIASTALVHDLTLVTHNVADFVNIPNLRVVDWLED